MTNTRFRARTGLRLAVAGLAVTMVGPAAAGAAEPLGQITQYPGVALPAAVEALTLGPNNLLWFTQAGGGSTTPLSNFDPKDKPAEVVVQSVTAPRGSSTVTRMLSDAGKTAVWYVNASNTAIVRWDRNGSSRTTNAFAPVPAPTPAPTPTTAAATSTTKAVTTTTAPPVPTKIVDFALSGPFLVTVTQNTDVSLTVFDATLANPAGTSVKLPLLSADSMVVGPDGNLWIAGAVPNAAGAHIIRVTVSGVLSSPASIPISAIANRPVQLVSNPANGTVVVFDSLNNVSTIDLKATGTAFSFGERVTNAIAGSDGRIWVVSKDSNKVSVLTGQAKTSYDLPVNSLANGAIAEDAQGNVWVGLAGLRKLARVGTALPVVTTTTVAATTTKPAATSTAAPTTTKPVPTTAAATLGAGNGLCPANTGYGFTTAGNEVCVPLPAVGLARGKRCARGQVSAYYGTGKGTAVVCVKNPGRSKRSIADQVASFAAEMDMFTVYPNFTAETDGNKTIFVTYDSAVQARRRCAELSRLMKRRRLSASLEISAADSATLDIRVSPSKFACRTLHR